MAVVETGGGGYFNFKMPYVVHRGGPLRSDSFTGLLSYIRLLLCRPFYGVAVGH